MHGLLKRFFVQQSGATAVEYALMAALITVVLVAAIGPLAVALTETFETVANAIPQTLP